MEQRSQKRRERPPLDASGLRAIALRYVGRYATTRAKLQIYLQRKIGERGWIGDGRPDIGALIEEFAGLGYVDDRAFADARGAALVRRGYGERRVAQALHHAGVEIADAEPARDHARESSLEAALRIARRRRIGPFATTEQAPQDQQRAIAALVRAGHDFTLARRIVMARPGEALDPDENF